MHQVGNWLRLYYDVWSATHEDIGVNLYSQGEKTGTSNHACYYSTSHTDFHIILKVHITPEIKQSFITKQQVWCQFLQCITPWRYTNFVLHHSLCQRVCQRQFTEANAKWQKCTHLLCMSGQRICIWRMQSSTRFVLSKHLSSACSVTIWSRTCYS